VFRRAFEPLPPSARQAVLNRAKNEHVPIGSIQTKALHIAQANEKASVRMNLFLTSYGFARNTCMAFAMAFIALVYAAAAHYENPRAKILFAAACFGLSLIMFFRYLDFHRQYNVTVLKAYAFPSTDTK
jgi:hypothetical protein